MSSTVYFMGLIVRLQSAPQSLPAALQSGFITITVNVRAFTHWEKKCAAGLKTKKQFSFYLCNKMSSLEEENENAIGMIYYSFYL